jgi:transposase
MGQTKKRKYDRYSLEYKLQAVKLANSLNVKAIEIADSLGIHPVMLYRWQMEHRRGDLKENKHMKSPELIIKETVKVVENKIDIELKRKFKSEKKTTKALEDKLAAAELRIKKLEQSLDNRTEELDLLKKAERFFAKKK